MCDVEGTFGPGICENENDCSRVLRGLRWSAEAGAVRIPGTEAGLKSRAGDRGTDIICKKVRRMLLLILGGRSPASSIAGRSVFSNFLSSGLLVLSGSVTWSVSLVSPSFGFPSYPMGIMLSHRLAIQV